MRIKKMDWSTYQICHISLRRKKFRLIWNPAGVEVALHLRRRLIVLQGRLTQVMEQLEEEEP